MDISEQKVLNFLSQMKKVISSKHTKGIDILQSKLRALDTQSPPCLKLLAAQVVLAAKQEILEDDHIIDFLAKVSSEEEGATDHQPSFRLAALEFVQQVKLSIEQEAQKFALQLDRLKEYSSARVYRVPPKFEKMVKGVAVLDNEVPDLQKADAIVIFAELVDRLGTVLTGPLGGALASYGAGRCIPVIVVCQAYKVSCELIARGQMSMQYSGDLASGKYSRIQRSWVRWYVGEEGWYQSAEIGRLAKKALFI